MNKQKCPLLAKAGIDIANRDDGIEICMNCPLPRCVYEVTKRTYREIQIRRAKVKVLCMEGKSQAEIARLLNVSDWTIHNDKKANKENKIGN